MNFEILLFSLLLCFHTIYAEIDYCKEEVGCKSAEENTMCMYNDTSSCEQGSGTMTDDKRKQILQLHNEYRAKLANGDVDEKLPKAANMKELTWDNELEQFAQRVALHYCTIDGHDACRKTKRYSQVGQNIKTEYGSSDAPEAIESGFDSWASESKNVKAKTIESFSNQGIKVGKFAQVAWANTHLIGCGEAIYLGKPNLLSPKKKMRVVVCNYATGVVNGEPIYVSGEPCGSCPSEGSCSEKYPGLCSVPLSEQDKEFTNEDISRGSRRQLNLDMYFSLVPPLIIMNFFIFS